MPWLMASRKSGWGTKQVAEGRPGGRGAWEISNERCEQLYPFSLRAVIKLLRQTELPVIREP